MPVGFDTQGIMSAGEAMPFFRQQLSSAKPGSEPHSARRR
jgi:hypothetical protein